MHFLRSTVYDPDKVRVLFRVQVTMADPDRICRQAYKLCSENDLVPEMVYLLGKIGDNKRALNLIIERLDDVKGVCVVMTMKLFTSLTPNASGDRICQRKER